MRVSAPAWPWRAAGPSITVCDRLRGGMTIDQRILIDPWGAILGKGEKFAAREGMHRANNETRVVFDAWCAAKPADRLPRRSDVHPERLGALADRTMLLDVLNNP